MMTDGFHKLRVQAPRAYLFRNMFTIAESDQLSAPLWDAAKGPSAYPSNAAFVKEHVSNLLTSSFPNMGPAESQVLVQGMFDYKKDLTLFKNHSSGISSQTKQFKSSDNSAMFAEEQAARDRRRSVSESRPFPACSRRARSTWATTDWSRVDAVWVGMFSTLGARL